MTDSVNDMVGTTALEGHRTVSRRQFLATASSGLGSAALMSLFAQDGLFADEANQADRIPESGPRFEPTATNCIYIFLAGGISHVDLLDPKPALEQHAGESLPKSFTKDVRFAFINASAKVLPSRYRFRKHGESGLEMSDLLPHLATCADDLAIVRSMHTDAFNHLPGHMLMNTGVEKFGRPSVGSWVLYGLGNESHDLPGYVVLTSRSLVRGGGANWSNGFLPPRFQGVQFHDRGEPVLNLRQPPGIPKSAQRASLDTLAELNRLRFDKQHDPEITSRIAAYELAFRMQSAAPELMDLSGESQKMLDDYGANRQGLQSVVATADSKPRAVSRTFSRNCLLARRLVERGVRFVTIFHGDWDHHSGLDRGLRQNCEGVDQPLAALIKDLKQRGLLDSTLVVIASEFGRTSLGQGMDGRDHHPFAFSTMLAGGGVRGGTVVGRTDEFGWRPIKDPVHVNDLHATMLHLFGLDHLQLTYSHQGRDFRLTDVAGNVVTKLLGMET